VDGTNWKLQVVQEVIQNVDSAYVIHEDQSTTRWKGEEQFMKGPFLHCVVGPDDLRMSQCVDVVNKERKTCLLKNIGMSGTSTTDADANVIVGHELLSELPGLLGECGTEHHIDVITIILRSCTDVNYAMEIDI